MEEKVSQKKNNAELKWKKIGQERKCTAISRLRSRQTVRRKDSRTDEPNSRCLHPVPPVLSVCVLFSPTLQSHSRKYLPQLCSPASP